MTRPLILTRRQREILASLQRQDHDGGVPVTGADREINVLIDNGLAERLENDNVRATDAGMARGTGF